jgi:PleD family two-component response regulator
MSGGVLRKDELPTATAAGFKDFLEKPYGANDFFNSHGNAGKSIMIVDDTPELCELFALCARRAGMEPYAFSDSSEAIGEYQRINPDILLTDLDMPGMDGYELLRRIRELENGAQKLPRPEAGFP